MQHDFTNLTNQKIRKYADLRDLYRNPQKNVQDIRTLNQELSDIDAQIRNLDNESLRKKGLEYSKTEGVYRTKGTLSLIKPLLAKRKSDTPLTKEEEKTLFHWDQSALLDSLSDNNWYNDRQVAFLTGNKELPVGSKELKSYLSKQRSNLSQNGSSVSFA
ncbi:MAG: hypothetical protein MK137_05960 [Rickettsiales bacterium]|nr:hypothetical protein [Rickettsiales bacterium]